MSRSYHNIYIDQPMPGISDDMINCVAFVIIILAVIYIIWHLMTSGRRCRGEGYLSGQAPPVGADTRAAGTKVTSMTDVDPTGYNNYIKTQALESAVEENHKKWLGEIPHRTTTASTDVDLSGDRYPVPWTGLRRPEMRTVQPDAPDVRQLPSEPPETMPFKTSYQI